MWPPRGGQSTGGLEWHQAETDNICPVFLTIVYNAQTFTCSKEQQVSRCDSDT